MEATMEMGVSGGLWWSPEVTTPDASPHCCFQLLCDIPLSEEGRNYCLAHGWSQCRASQPWLPVRITWAL
jgi:hypothetical protein